MGKNETNWDVEFDKIVDNLFKAWSVNNIQEFLIWHMRLNQLFTHKLQYSLDNAGKIIHEYKMDIPMDVIEKIDKFNRNCVKLDDVPNLNPEPLPSIESKEPVKEVKQESKDK